MISQDRHARRLKGMSSFDDLTLRLSTPSDAQALRRLAQLDDADFDGSPAVIAEAQGRPLAALPLDGGPAFADPFEHTAEIVALLRLRLAQLAAAEEAGVRPALGLARRAARRLRRYRDPVSA